MLVGIMHTQTQMHASHAQTYTQIQFPHQLFHDEICIRNDELIKTQ